jgi:hypothetical protein
MLGEVTDLDVALITGGFTITAVIVTFGGNALLDMVRARRAARESRGAAIAEVLTASIDLVLAVNAIRAAYQHRTNSRARMLIAAALLRDLPDLNSWKALTERYITRTALSTLTGLVRERDEDTRMIVLDFASLVVPKTNRFFAAVTTVTLGPDKELAGATRQLSTAGAELLETSGARKRKQDRARSRFERELGKFRAAADRRKR